MVTEDQSEIVEWLGAASTHGGASVERIDAHTGVVFLAGARAWKLKRAVRFDYLDSSTAERRKQLCEAEVALKADERALRGLIVGIDSHVGRELGGRTAGDEAETGKKRGFLGEKRCGEEDGECETDHAFHVSRPDTVIQPRVPESPRATPLRARPDRHADRRSSAPSRPHAGGGRAVQGERRACRDRVRRARASRRTA